MRPGALASVLAMLLLAPVALAAQQPARNGQHEQPAARPSSQGSQPAARPEPRPTPPPRQATPPEPRRAEPKQAAPKSTGEPELKRRKP